MQKDAFKVLVPTGMLGYGFPEKWFLEGLKRNPDMISVDSGSTDSGPQKLALGEMTCSKEAYYKEIRFLVTEGKKHHIPVFISSAGGDGTNGHVDLFVDLAKQAAAETGLKLRIGVIYADIDKNLILQRMKEGRVKPCGGNVPELTEKDVHDAVEVVAQMGSEPYARLWDREGYCDVVISGRSYDPSPMAAMAIHEGFDPGLAWHMAKIAECGAMCAEPMCKTLLVTLKKDCFYLESMDPAGYCRTYSVAAHTLYEKSHPYLLKGPGGTLNLKDCVFEQVSDRVCRVSGSRFIPDKKYTVKMEAACPVGYRSICVCGTRDPIMIEHIDSTLKSVRNMVKETFPEEYAQSQLIYHVYGKNGVMGELEFTHQVAHELCIIIEVASPTQEMARILCNKARTTLLHFPYEGRIATGANIGLPFTPLEIPLGKVCKFNIYHLMELNDPCEVFPYKVMEVE
jgi:hypothetical protein